MMNQEFRSLKEAAAYAHLSPMSVYVAIRKGKLKAEKKRVSIPGRKRQVRWVLSKEALDDYRRNKFNRECRMIDGKAVYDLADDRWGVIHAAKTLSAMIGKPFHASSIYWRIKTGEIKCRKLGRHWIIPKEEVVKVYESLIEKENDDSQMKFV